MYLDSYSEEILFKQNNYMQKLIFRLRSQKQPACESDDYRIER